MKNIVAFTLLMIVATGTFAATTTWNFPTPFETFEDKPIDLNKVIGKQPVYIKFWASWCLDCRREFPELEQDYQRLLKSDNPGKLAMFAVNLNINEDHASIAKIVEKNGMTIPIILDNNGAIASHFSFHGTPFHVLIDGKGNVVYTSYHRDDTLLAGIQKLAKGETVKPVTEAVSKTLATPLKALPAQKDGILFFTTTWCVDYMGDVKPELAQSCQHALDIIKTLATENPSLPVQVYVTHLWTEAVDVKSFTDTTKLPYPVTIDKDNREFQRNKIGSYPSVLIIKNGKEVERIEVFSDKEKVLETLIKFSKKS